MTTVCCVQDCDKPAEWEIWTAKGHEDNTYACTEHVGALLTDAAEHRIYPVSENKPAEEGSSQKDFGEPCKSCAWNEPTLRGSGWRPCSPSTARECDYWKSLQKQYPPDPSAPSEVVGGEGIVGDYKNEGLSSPTCKGRWWRCFRGKAMLVHIVGGELGWFWGNSESNHPNECAYDLDSVRYIGPIPVPEDKPALIHAHCPDAVEKANKSAREVCEAMDKLAPSEDEGEKWGKLLWECQFQLPKEAPASLQCSWEDLGAPCREMVLEAALRFRAEVLKEQSEALGDLAMAANYVCNEAIVFGVSTKEGRDRVAALKNVLCGYGFRDDTNEPPKPRPSDEELGRFVLEIIKRHLEPYSGQVKLTLEASSIAPELGAAIRAFQGEAPKTTVSDEEGR